MDIAAVNPVTPSHRPDPVRGSAATGDPYRDDFAAELDAASAEAETPAKSESSAKTGKTATNANPVNADKTNQAHTVDQPVDAAPVAPQAAMALTVPPQPQASIAVAAKTPQDGTIQTAPQATAGLTAPPRATAPQPDQPTAPTGEVGLIQQTAAAMMSGQTATAPRTAAPASKTPNDSKAETAPTIAQTQGTAPSQNPVAPPVPTSAAQSGTQQNDAGQQQGQGIQTAHTSQNLAATPNTQEFKVDVSAAAAAMQPASQAAQNAPVVAPALIAQNAPVFVPPEALGVAIAHKALAGVNKFELRLDPPEMGRLDVSLEVDESGHVRAHIRAERPEALELLQREAKGMEQALRQAGLSLDQSSLSFSLNARDGREAHEHHHHGRRAKFNAVLPEDEINAAALRGTASSTSALDLRV